MSTLRLPDAAGAAGPWPYPGPTGALGGWFRWLLLVAACCPTFAVADETALQRERIAREHAAVERQAQLAQAACAREFAVTACMDRAKAVRREQLQQLDRERAVLDRELRRQRAAGRAEQIEQRQTPRGNEQPVPAPRTRSPAAVIAPKPHGRSPASAAAAHEAAASQSQVQASARADAAARRAEQAEAHRVAVEQRNRDLARRRAPAAPLPPPPPSAASR